MEIDMHHDLEQAFNKVIEILQADGRCKGGWHYGSVGRGTSDVYSDYDPVFLVAGKDFEEFSNDVPMFLSSACDELLICWPENYNSNHFKNFCNMIRIGSNLHQLDFFILNANRTEEWWCRQHLKGCTRENIIFDRTGEVGTLLDRGLRTDNHIPDTKRAMDTYWFHTMMLVKYFKRRDIFKLLKNVDMIFHAHVDLLLSQYDTMDWGAWESKVKQCVPEEKQRHLKEYFTLADFESVEKAMKKCMLLFWQDAQEVCTATGVTYSNAIAAQTITYFNNCLMKHS
jgi:hypothetical protein